MCARVRLLAAAAALSSALRRTVPSPSRLARRPPLRSRPSADTVLVFLRVCMRARALCVKKIEKKWVTYTSCAHTPAAAPRHRRPHALPSPHQETAKTTAPVAASQPPTIPSVLVSARLASFPSDLSRRLPAKKTARRPVRTPRTRARRLACALLSTRSRRSPRVAGALVCAHARFNCEFAVQALTASRSILSFCALSLRARSVFSSPCASSRREKTPHARAHAYIRTCAHMRDFSCMYTCGSLCRLPRAHAPLCFSPTVYSRSRIALGSRPSVRSFIRTHAQVVTSIGNYALSKVRSAARTRQQPSLTAPIHPFRSLARLFAPRSARPRAEPSTHAHARTHTQFHTGVTVREISATFTTL